MTSASGRLGTLRLSTRASPSGLAAHSTADAAIRAATSQWYSFSTLQSIDTAIPGMP